MRCVFVSGCWDCFHPGHLDFLEFARQQGDHLTVSVASDDTIRRLKGREPFYPEHDRYRIVQALRCVDRTFIARGSGLDFDFLPYLKELKPDVWVVGDDDLHLGEKVRIAAAHRIELVVSYRPSLSWKTSCILDKLHPNHDGALECRPEPRTQPHGISTSP